MRLRRSTPRSPVRPVPLPHPGVWLLGTVVAGVAAFLVFDRADGAWSSFIAAACVIGALYGYRRMRFSWLARRPGPVEVMSFTDTTGGVISVDDVMSEIRTALDRVNLQLPSTGAAEPGGIKLLDVVRSTANNAKTPLAAAAGLLQALVVTHAYQVTGAVRYRQGAVEPLGLTVQVATLPSAYSRNKTYWGTDWSRVAEQAAAFVGAYVLPRSRLCRQPPWEGWYGLNLPAELFDEYLQATRFRTANRLEEALDRFHKALRLDPLNAHLRFAIGGIQKRLALHIDALATYVGVLALEAWSDRRLFSRFQAVLAPSLKVLPPRRFSARPHRRALLVARYNIAEEFGTGELLTRQWTATRPNDGKGTARDRERERLRVLLQPWVEHYVDGFVRWLGDPRLSKAAEHQTRAATLRHLEHEVPKLQLFFQYIAWEEHVSMIRDYSLRSGRRRSGLPVSQASLRIFPLWAVLRMAWTWHEVLAPEARARATGPLSEASGMPPGWATIFESEAWPPDSVWLRARVEASMRPAWYRRLTYADYYNASAAVAVCLLPKTAAAPDRNPPRRLDPRVRRQREEERVRLEQRRADREPGIASLAVHYLERAMHNTESGFLATRWEWVASEDPDLAGLRPRDAFVRFETDYLPTYGPALRRPAEVLRLELAHHNVRTVIAYASIRADFWRLKASSLIEAGSAGVDNLLYQERRAWELLCRTSAEIRHWPARLRLINAAARLASEIGTSFPAPAFPDFQDDPLADVLRDNKERDEQAIRQAIDKRNAALVELSERVISAPWLVDGDTRAVDTGPPLALTARALRADGATTCRLQADRWASVVDWLQAVLRDIDTTEAHNRFVGCTRSLWAPADVVEGAGAHAGGELSAIATGAVPLRVASMDGRPRVRHSTKNRRGGRHR